MAGNLIKFHHHQHNLYEEVTCSVGSGFRVDSNRSGKMQSGRVESRAVLTLVILTG